MLVKYKVDDKWVTITLANEWTVSAVHAMLKEKGADSDNVYINGRRVEPAVKSPLPKREVERVYKYSVNIKRKPELEKFFADNLSKLIYEKSNSLIGLGVCPSSLGRYKNNQRSPRLKVFLQLCDKFNVSPNELIGWDDVKKHANNKSE